MFDMLFVSSSHPLSPYIFSLDARCKQLTERERTRVKEQLDPKARFVLQQLHTIAFMVLMIFMLSVEHHEFYVTFIVLSNLLLSSIHMHVTCVLLFVVDLLDNTTLYTPLIGTQPHYHSQMLKTIQWNVLLKITNQLIAIYTHRYYCGT